MNSFYSTKRDNNGNGNNGDTHRSLKYCIQNLKTCLKTRSTCTENLQQYKGSLIVEQVLASIWALIWSEKWKMSVYKFQANESRCFMLFNILARIVRSILLLKPK